MKTELPEDQHVLVDFARARYNDTSIVRHGKANGDAWDGAHISGHGVVALRIMLPFKKPKNQGEAQLNTAFNDAFLRVMPADPAVAQQTGLPVSLHAIGLCL